VHHDIKAKNLVRFFDGRYRLIDFDNARERDKAPFGNTSIDICAPEIAQALLHKQRTISRPEMDMWYDELFVRFFFLR
jgi:serine/threonine protein kinase